jgi:2-polyprenyl-3-methyl-5-hydroxy-6-metoxy-1,4-benzoquinol methylase
MESQVPDNATADESYTRLQEGVDDGSGFLHGLRVKVYRRHVRGLSKGRALDVGCGIGMNLRHLAEGSVGVDHNPTSIEVARRRGLTAYTTRDFLAGAGEEYKGAFDTLLVAHVLEHVEHETGVALVRDYLPYLKPAARIVILTPNDRHLKLYSHIRFVDFKVVRQTFDEVGGIAVERTYGFPLPVTVAGSWRTINEFVTVARRA